MFPAGGAANYGVSITMSGPGTVLIIQVQSLHFMLASVCCVEARHESGFGFWDYEY